MPIWNPKEAAIHLTRNVSVQGRRTSMRLEQPFWDAFEEIVRREGISMNALVTRVWAASPDDVNLAGAIRVFVLGYFWALANGGRPRVPPGSTKP
ncbi:ribbon-helix-helix domain-containing protein [Inquilinus ginsengisoli]|uniref:ribbon-helix-helix domain-containing protein n=1 Tax=Inquilinus ginsengisoli TaxID=363840 RepID=UPI003D1A32C6